MNPVAISVPGYRRKRCQQLPQLQIKAVASPRNQSSNVLSQLEPGTFLNKSHPRNHQERTAVSRGGGGRFLLSESEDLSQRTDNQRMRDMSAFSS